MDLAEIQSQINELKALAAALQREPSSLRARVFQKYIEFESTPKVAKYLREAGIRTSRNTSFDANDVSQIIQNGSEGIDEVIVTWAQRIFRQNRRSVQRHFG
jgi:hypothetical protein